LRANILKESAGKSSVLQATLLAVAYLVTHSTAETVDISVPNRPVTDETNLNIWNHAKQITVKSDEVNTRIDKSKRMRRGSGESAIYILKTAVEFLNSKGGYGLLFECNGGFCTITKGNSSKQFSADSLMGHITNLLEMKKDEIKFKVAAYEWQSAFGLV
jgi:hypothetical protein